MTKMLNILEVLFPHYLENIIKCMPTLVEGKRGMVCTCLINLLAFAIFGSKMQNAVLVRWKKATFFIGVNYQKPYNVLVSKLVI